MAEAFDEFGLSAHPSGQCVDGTYNSFAERVNAVVLARSVVEVPFACCWLDPGPVPDSVGRVLADMHRGCDERRCRGKQRGQQAIMRGGRLIPMPECQVAEEQIAVTVDRVAVAEASVKAAGEAMQTGRDQAWSALISATAEAGFARWHRDLLFLRGLPAEGMIPVSMMTRFGMTVREVRRLVPGLRASVAPRGRRNR